ncbi:DUF2975 domain-containing protein [Cohaesibacter intestini]|uniref:DUF2975 domain-containing protein n=1 Tax=Cohaesibacter intestini TaxID=2211145 RepID=UPI000DE84428|nr:DUF2975 domain-containing protein [Cohaesibacter intestini]
MAKQSGEQHVRIGRIARVSGIMKWVLTTFMALVFLIGILVLLLLLNPDWLEAGNEVIDFGDSGRTYGDVPQLQRWTLAFFYDACVGTFLMTLWYMRSVFARLQILDFFSSKTLSAMVWCGIWFVVFGVMDFLEEPVASVLTTLDLPEGQRQLAIELEGGEIFFIIFGVMFMTLGWVMREAARLQEENNQFI